MMLEFIPPDRIRLDPGQIHLYDSAFDWHSVRLGPHLITGISIYWDPSSGRHKADNSVCVCLYRDDRNHNIFIDDIMYMHVSDNDTHPLNSQCEMVLDFMFRHKSRRISIETNGLGNALPEILCDVAKRRGENIYVNKITNNKNKADRILNAIEPVLTSGHLYAHTRIQQTPFVAEMLGWSPLGGVSHDDGLDAVAGAIAQVPIAVHSGVAQNKIFHANTNVEL